MGPCRQQNDLIPEDDTTALVGSIINTLPVSDVNLKKIIEAQDVDEIFKQIKQYCLKGWPGKHQLSSILKPYWNERVELLVNVDVILKSSRILIHSSVRPDVLDKISHGHQAITKYIERAKQALLRLGLSRQIQDMVESCRICTKYRINKPEPLFPSPFPERPWQVLGADFVYSQSLDYLLVVNDFSRFLEVAALRKNKTATEVLTVFKAVFIGHCSPEKTQPDNGLPFNTADHALFARGWRSETPLYIKIMRNWWNYKILFHYLEIGMG